LLLGADFAQFFFEIVEVTFVLAQFFTAAIELFKLLIEIGLAVRAAARAGNAATTLFFLTFALRPRAALGFGFECDSLRWRAPFENLGGLIAGGMRPTLIVISGIRRTAPPPMMAAPTREKLLVTFFCLFSLKRRKVLDKHIIVRTSRIRYQQ